MGKYLFGLILDQSTFFNCLFPGQSILQTRPTQMSVINRLSAINPVVIQQTQQKQTQKMTTLKTLSITLLFLITLHASTIEMPFQKLSILNPSQQLAVSIPKLEMAATAQNRVTLDFVLDAVRKGNYDELAKVSKKIDLKALITEARLRSTGRFRLERLPEDRLASDKVKQAETPIEPVISKAPILSPAKQLSPPKVEPQPQPQPQPQSQSQSQSQPITQTAQPKILPKDIPSLFQLQSQLNIDQSLKLAQANNIPDLREVEDPATVNWEALTQNLIRLKEKQERAEDSRAEGRADGGRLLANQQLKGWLIILLIVILIIIAVL